MAEMTLSIDLSEFIFEYDRKTDTFFFRLLSTHRWVAQDVGGEYFVLLDVESQKPVGILVEDFRAVFLKRHPDLENVWNEAHVPWRRWSNGLRQSARQIFVGFFASQTQPHMSFGATSSNR